ncbi:UpxY family transcription antiterminator [Fulvivirga sp. M361]|uniref:transcription termination/antitermination protein NusG n=1 Tax=Fulvivirga sp. M361 TaxID=2594266 RepID=UPI001179AC83|nr:UpxY family transcription antiterminator [Fulvivirga sp. M361]TRX50212.1 UpxY family transcription antiterminator [Fulvivirga sp. M361]
MTKSWYVAYTKPRNEKKVTERLTSRDFEVYCPLIKVLKQWSDRKKMVSMPMFTSYIFVRLMEPERKKVLHDPGVLNFVYWQGEPATLRETEIDSIRKIEQNGLEIHVSGDRPNHGEPVIITEGVFKGLSGEVRRIDKNRLSVWVESIKSLVTFTYELN